MDKTQTSSMNHQSSSLPVHKRIKTSHSPLVCSSILELPLELLIKIFAIVMDAGDADLVRYGHDWLTFKKLGVLVRLGSVCWTFRCATRNESLWYSLAVDCGNTMERIEQIVSLANLFRDRLAQVRACRFVAHRNHNWDVAADALFAALPRLTKLRASFPEAFFSVIFDGMSHFPCRLKVLHFEGIRPAALVKWVLNCNADIEELLLFPLPGDLGDTLERYHRLERLQMCFRQFSRRVSAPPNLRLLFCSTPGWQRPEMLRMLWDFLKTSSKLEALALWTAPGTTLPDEGLPADLYFPQLRTLWFFYTFHVVDLLLDMQARAPNLNKVVLVSGDRGRNDELRIANPISHVKIVELEPLSWATGMKLFMDKPHLL